MLPHLRTQTDRQGEDGAGRGNPREEMKRWGREAKGCAREDRGSEVRTANAYCASAASMLAEEFWQIAEGFVEVPVNL